MTPRAKSRLDETYFRGLFKAWGIGALIAISIGLAGHGLGLW